MTLANLISIIDAKLAYVGASDDIKNGTATEKFAHLTGITVNFVGVDLEDEVDDKIVDILYWHVPGGAYITPDSEVSVEPGDSSDEGDDTTDPDDGDEGTTDPDDGDEGLDEGDNDTPFPVEPTMYTLTFLCPQTVCEGNKLTVEEGTVVDLTQYIPVYEGHTFNGWTDIDQNLFDPQEILMDSNKTITPWYSITEYKITFYMNDNTDVDVCAVAYSDIAHNVSESYPVNPVRTGYTFSGWGLTSTSTTPIDDDMMTPANDLDLYAIWTPAVGVDEVDGTED